MHWQDKGPISGLQQRLKTNRQGILSETRSRRISREMMGHKGWLCSLLIARLTAKPGSQHPLNLNRKNQLGERKHNSDGAQSRRTRRCGSDYISSN